MFEQHSRAIVEGMGARSGGFNPGYFDGKRAEKRACDTYRVDRGAKVMAIAWQRGLGGGARASDLPVAFHHSRRKSGGGERNRGRKTIGAGTDDGSSCHRTKTLTDIDKFLPSTILAS